MKRRAGGGRRPAEALRQLDALVMAHMHLATLAVPAMRRLVSGRIVKVSSSITHVTFAMTGWYQAAEHVFSAVTAAFRRGAARDGIDVILIEPAGPRHWDLGQGRGRSAATPRARPGLAAYDRPS